jgi:hypothetical protein
MGHRNRFVARARRLVSAMLLAGFAPFQPALAAPAPPTAATDQPACRGGFNDMYSARRGLPHHSLMATTQLVGAGSQTQIVLANPDTAIPTVGLHMRTFFIDGMSWGRTYGGDAKESFAQLVSDTLQGDQYKPIAERLQISQTGNYLLQVDVRADLNSGFLPTKKRLVIFVCKQDGTLAAWADTELTLSSQHLPVIAGLFVVAAMYLFCGIVVYRSRLRLAEATRKQQKKTAVYRFEPLKEWSLPRCLDPIALSSDVFDCGSLANLQILFFTLLVSYGLIYIVMRTGELSSISTTVVELLGISALGSLGSNVTSVTRNRLKVENWAWLVTRKVLPLNDSGRGTPRWSDLIMSDTELDLYKLQALMFTVIVGLGMIVGGFSLATFSVPPELLEVLGLSQAVFVGGRLTQPASMGDLDKLLDELRKREGTLRKAAASGVDVDGNGDPKGDPAPGKPFTDIAEAAAPNAVPNATDRYLETASQVKVMLESIAHRKVDADELKDPPLASGPMKAKPAPATPPEAGKLED